jgi:hypothetical protein
MHEDDGFKVWMEQVDAYTVKLCGLSIYNLPDWHYRDAYDDRTPPARAALSAIRAAKDY